VSTREGPGEFLDAPFPGGGLVRCCLKADDEAPSGSDRNRGPQGSFPFHDRPFAACRDETKRKKTMNENRNQGHGQGGQGQDRNQRQDPNQRNQDQRSQGQFGEKDRHAEGGQRGGDQGRQQQDDQRVGQDRNRETAR
jgi:hypothetical protein